MRLWGATMCPRPGAAGRSHLLPEARGGGPEERLRAGGQGQHPRPEAVAGRSNPKSGGCSGMGGLEELSHAEGQEGQW